MSTPAGTTESRATLDLPFIGGFAVALCGGHGGGANDLARSVAAALGATPVVTTATDATSTPALDTFAGFSPVGDLAGGTLARPDGRPPPPVRTRRLTR